MYDFLYSFRLYTKGISFVEQPYRKIIKHWYDSFCFLHLKLNTIWIKEWNNFYDTWAWHALRTGTGGTQMHRKNDRGQKDMEGEEGWYRNLPVHMERSHSKLAEMEAFHYINKIRTPPRAQWRHTTSQCLNVRLSDQSYLPAHVFHMQLPWSLQIE